MKRLIQALWRTATNPHAYERCRRCAYRHRTARTGAPRWMRVDIPPEPIPEDHPSRTMPARV
jgi:hypothetical protein